MKNYSHNTNGLFGYAGYSPHRRHIVYLMLAIVILIGSSTLTPAQAAAPSQAAPTGFIFYLDAKADKGNLNHICVGQPVFISVNAQRWRVSVPEANKKNLPMRIFGITVDGSMTPSLGKLSIANKALSVSTPPGTTRFLFIPQKPGKTEIIFKGRKVKASWWDQLIGGDKEYLATSLKATVVSCKFDVHIISHFSAQNVHFVATLDGVLEPGADGYLAGVADVKWIRAYGAAGSCSGEFDIGSSKANLSGSLSDNESVAIDVKYLPAVLSNPIKCKTASKTITANVTPDPLNFSIPTSFAVRRRSQGLYGPPYYSMKGTAEIAVFPQETSQ